jgi:hypothetical protein
LALQRLAAGIVAGSRGLHRVHPGQICDAVTRSGLDPSAWTARQVITALNADMRARGSCWPEEIHNPGGFLVSRLRRLPNSPTVVETASPPRTADARDPGPAPASSQARAAARAYVIAHLRAARNARQALLGGAAHEISRRPAQAKMP